MHTHSLCGVCPILYIQIANIYITVTAGSLWRSLADILESPQNVLTLLGKSLPTVVGYFVALLITKILAGLPMVFLRVGALGRMVFLRTLFSKNMLTQRELDEVYRPENVQYGWEVRRRIVRGQRQRGLLAVVSHMLAPVSPFAVSDAAIGDCDLLYLRLYLSYYSACWRHLLCFCIDGLQEAALIRLHASV